MFEVDWHNSQTLLLNLTNLGLGILVVLSVGAALYDVGLDLVEKWRRGQPPAGAGNSLLSSSQVKTPEKTISEASAQTRWDGRHLHKSGL